MNQKGYDGARFLLSLVEMFSWLSAVTSLFMAVRSVGDAQALLPSTAWLALCLSSIGASAACRVGQAILDIAANSQRAVQLLSDAAGAQRSRTEEQRPRDNDAAAFKPARGGNWPIGKIEIYRGHEITGLVNRVFAAGLYFDSVEEAKLHLNSISPDAG